MGWIKLHRETLEKAIWKCSTAEQKVVFITILMLANHKENQWLWKGKQFKCQPGQFVTSLKSLANYAHVSDRNVRTALDKFIKLEFLTNESTKEGRLITINNWDRYQNLEYDTDKQPDKEVTNNRQTVDKEVTTNNNNKKEKNIINKEIYITFLNLFNEITGRDFKGTDKDQKQFNARMKEGVTIEDFGRAIKNCKSDPYHKDNPNYLTPEFITRADKFQRYLNYQTKIKESSFD